MEYSSANVEIPAKHSILLNVLHIDTVLLFPGLGMCGTVILVPGAYIALFIAIIGLDMLRFAPYKSQSSIMTTDDNRRSRS